MRGTQVVERASKAQPRVRQVKILVDEEGAGTRGGGGPRSKGIGFVQFEDHEHALCALRQLNNNPKPWGKVGPLRVAAFPPSLALGLEGLRHCTLLSEVCRWWVEAVGIIGLLAYCSPKSRVPLLVHHG